MRPWYTFLAEQEAAQGRRVCEVDASLSNPWMLTDPAELKARRHDDASRRALGDFWAEVTDIRSAFHTVWHLRRAVWSRGITYLPFSGARNVPWPSVYRARRDIVVGALQVGADDLLMAGTRNSGGQVLITVVRLHPKC
jgi:hypothetical protein